MSFFVGNHWILANIIQVGWLDRAITGRMHRNTRKSACNLKFLNPWDLTRKFKGPIARGDGCGDVYEAVQLSGEPFVPEIQNLFPGGKPRPSLSLPNFNSIVRRVKAWREKDLEYWMSTAEATGGRCLWETRTKTWICELTFRLDRPVEAIISPVTPYASIEPGNFKHSGKSNEHSSYPLIFTLSLK